MRSACTHSHTRCATLRLACVLRSPLCVRCRPYVCPLLTCRNLPVTPHRPLPSVRNKRIHQEVIYTTDQKKKSMLLKVLQRAERPVLVFVNVKKETEMVGRFLEKAGVYCTVTHGGKDQATRDETLQDFKEGRSDVLVATDVLGRGLDIKGIAHVINYDLPTTIERYTHRIGRTGRAGEDGKATSLFTDDDAKILYDLKEYLLSTDHVIPNELAKHPAAQVRCGTSACTDALHDTFVG